MQLPDGQIADNAISTLKELKQTMSQGNNIHSSSLLVSTYLELTYHFAPKKYFDRYLPAENVELATCQCGGQRLSTNFQGTW